MITKISAALSFLLFVCLATPLDNHFFGVILQPGPAFAQGGLVLEDFALYSQKEIKLYHIGESRGNVGSNGSIDIKKGASGLVIGSFQVLDRIKNEAEIGIYGDVTARVIENRGSMSVSGQNIENAELVPLILPTLLFSSAGPDLEVSEKSAMTIDPGSYGRLRVKKGAAVKLSSGEYYFVKFEIDESASVNLDASGGAIYINVVEKIKFKKDAAMQIVSGHPEDILFSYRGTGKVEVDDHAVLRGILRAPSAKVEFKKGSRLEGAAYADSIHLEKGASFRHYAASLDGRPPTADAGGYQTAPAGGQIELDGSGSSDPDGDAITYHWSFVSLPDGSSPALSDPASPMPTFTADLAGVYVIELAVDDGTYASLRDTAIITAVSEVLDVSDFVLYADDKIKMDEISGGAGHVGANRHIHIEKGASGTITGDLRVLDHIKNKGEIIIDGNVYTNSKVDDHGDFKVTGMKNENAELVARKLPSISFSAEGPGLKVHASSAQVLAPGTYGRVEVKKGATLQFITGSYFLRKLKTDDSAILIFEASEGAIELNVVKKLEFGKNAAVQIAGGSTRDVRINYAGKKEVEIEDRGVLRGTLVAPQAKVEFEKGSRLEGAVYAKKIYLDKGVSFQFHEPDAANNPPVADTQTITTAEDTPASIVLSGSDPDGDSLTFNVISQPLYGTLAGTAPDFIYTPGRNFNGADGFSFAVNDGTVDSDPAMVNIAVTAVNDAPVAIAQSISLSEDESTSAVLTGFDAEGDTLAFEIVGQPSNGTLSRTAPDLTYTPDENFHGDDSFSFRANDGSLTSKTAIVSLTINSVNDAPVADAGPDQTVFKGDTVSLNGSGSHDVDGSTLSFQWAFTSVPAGSTAALSDPSIANPVFVPEIVGTYEVQLIANDGTINSSPDTVVATVEMRIVSVPDVVGQIQADAVVVLAAANLAVGTIATAFSDTVPADHIISQSPVAGTSVVEGSAVDLVVSLGPEKQAPTVSISTSPAEIHPGQSSTLTWNSTNADSAHIDNGIGLVNLNDSKLVSPQHSTAFTITVTGPDGNANATVTVKVHGDPEPQPEGHFGEQYEDLVPPDATVDQYDPKRFSLITGLVHDIHGVPIADVFVTIHGHLEYGTVATDTEGQYSIPVEGGSPITIVFQKEELITAHRKVNVPWNDIAIAETVEMTAEDPASTTLTFDGNPAAVVTHQSTPVTDEFGSRSATMVFTGDNRAFLVDENGNDVQELTTITTRATEYTTPESMPAKLPPTSAYTYCVELSVDGAQSVRFKKPVITWVDNFLGFPVGEVVPVGYYNRDRGVWVPSDNGVVVKLLDTDGNGMVDALDTNGDDHPDDLNSSNSFTDEVAGLSDSERYAPGSTFWRVEIIHFSPWDFNWPWRLPSDSIPPNPKAGPHADLQKTKITDCRGYNSSFVEERSRIFHEDIFIPGTDLTLHYASNRAEGYKTFITIPVSGDTVPDSLKRIVVKVEVAGRRFEQVLDPLSNQLAEFEWDGRDHLGQRVVGFTSAHTSIGFVYDVFFAFAENSGTAFAQPGLNRTAILTRQEQILWQRKDVFINKTKGLVAEGWTLSTQHFISPTDPSTLHKGDGMTIRNKAGIVNTIVGSGPTGPQHLFGGYGGDGGPADKARVSLPIDMAMDAFGNLYIADFLNSRVRKVDTNGIITTVAGDGIEGFGGDGGPATEARLQYPTGVAVDAAGNIYIADRTNNRIRKVDPNGIITTVAGSGPTGVYEGGYSGDGGPATEAQLNYPLVVEVDDAGNIYIADSINQCIRKVDPNGIITTMAGIYGAIEDLDYRGDGGPATAAQFFNPIGLALDADGNLFIADINMHLVRKVDTNGIITTVAGACRNCREYNGDGIPATEAHLNGPSGIVVDADGNVYIGEQHNNRVRKVDTNGVITTVAGSGTRGFSGDGGPATEAQFDGSGAVLIGPSGNLIIADTSNNRIRKVAFLATYPALAGASEATNNNFAEENGLGHVMYSSGHHKMTIDVDTGVILRQFAYDQNNQLISITDQFGGQIVIERDSSGVPTAVVSPDGIVTQLTINDKDHLTRITYPDGSFYGFEYSPDGLMTAKIEPEDNRFEHVFDSAGRLTEALDDEGGQWIYSNTVNDSGEILANVLTAEGNLTTYLDHTYSTDAYYSNITDPTGAETLFTRAADGLTANKSLPCGMDLEFEYAFDSEYKYKYVKKITERTPAGLEKVTLKDRTYQDTDSDGIPDRITEAVTVNNMPATVVNNTLLAQKVVNSPEGRTVTSFYNPSTLLTESVSIPGLYDTTYGYDSKGRLISTSTNTRQSTFAYGLEGFLESVTDSENHTTTYSYDPVGRVTGISRPDGSFVGFTYDSNGNMTVLTNPADVDHGFGFNSVNRNSSYETPLSGSYSFIYDRERRLIQNNFPSGKSIFNVYADPENPDDKSRLRQIRTPEGNIDFAYLCGTKIDSITKDTESITYGYDGRLVTSELLSGTLNHTLDYTYNNDFDVSSFTYVGATVNYNYDNDGLLTGVGSFTIIRNADNGLPVAVTGGALNLTRTFSGYGELDAQATAVNSQDVAFWSLTRDNYGRITAKTETVDGATSGYEYTYDTMGRLLSVTKDSALVEEYQYDINGTRTYEMNALRGIAARSYSYSDEDHLLAAGSVTYSYDLDGFLTTRSDGSDVTNYSYSSRGELLSVSLPDGRTIEYVHDPLGRRIAKKVDGVIIEKYLWQGLTRLLAVYDGADNLVMRFEYADGRMPVTVNAGGVTYYPAYDQVGSLRFVADSVGNVIKSVEYDSFGNILSDSNPIFAMPFGFAGGLHDRDTGLVRFGYRDYDPDVGRWTAKDPIFFAGGDTDLYGYVLNDPINSIDPDGLKNWGKIAIGSALTFSGAVNIGLVQRLVNVVLDFGNMNFSYLDLYLTQYVV